MLAVFSSNKRRRRTSKGNYAFRRRKPARVEVHRLDLNPETDASRRATLRKRAGTGARLAFGLISAIVLVALMKVVVMEAFVTNPKFHIQNIEVVTKGPLSKKDLTTASGLKLGQNLLMVSLRAVRERIEALPEVRSVSVTREFPGMVVLEVAQRAPVAWLECPDKAITAKVTGYGCLLDEEGIVLPSAKQASVEQKLPVISVEKLPRIAPGRKIESDSALAALQLLRLHAHSPQSRTDHLGRIDATRAHALVAAFDSGIKVTFPADADLATQLVRLERTLAAAAKRNIPVATVNLLVEHNVPVTAAGSATTTLTSGPAPSGRRSLASNR